MSDFLPIGFITKSHGLKGGVALTLRDIDSALLKTIFIEIDKEKIPYTILSISSKGPKCYASLDGVTTIEEANNLKGCKIFLHKDDKAVPETALFENEIANFSVVDKSRGNIGLADGLQNIGGLIYLTIKTPVQEEVLIPTNSPFIKSIKKQEKKIHVHLPDDYPGL